MAFICGSIANEEDDLVASWSYPPTPKKKLSKRRHSFGSRSNKDNKNPYSNRGLDKFEALLADLDGKRQQIYTQKGSEDISLVRFAYSNSNDVKPIVVKIKDHKKQEKVENTKPRSPSPKHEVSKVVQPTKLPLVDNYNMMISVDQLRKKFSEWWRPWYSLPLFVILILVFLVFFGRSFAILCTSLGWYMVPSINGTFENTNRKKKIVKKEYSRKLSDKIITSPRSPINHQPHRKSF
ncbi:uncharacterized protein [Rutidosis leptorrhynchoides]|uniref:uncharacterized protein n=1 Tax=Rutidosis leptorrhynchoides TaxID=125765 RepID=UPI003A992C07